MGRTGLRVAARPSCGLDHAETRFSKLTQIDTAHVGKLGLVRRYDLESNRGIEARAVVIDGIMSQLRSLTGISLG